MWTSISRKRVVSYQAWESKEIRLTDVRQLATLSGGRRIDAIRLNELFERGV
jgi:hypothetical protein